MNEGEIKLAASRRGTLASIEGLVLPPNLEEVMRNAEQWNVSYDSIQQLLDYAARDLPAFPAFTKSVVLRVTDFPHDEACNVICMFRMLELDERWIKDQVPQLSMCQYVGMAYCEAKEMWHTVVLGFGSGLGAELVLKPGSITNMATLMAGVQTPPAHQIDSQHLHHAMGIHFWFALKALETRGLTFRTMRGGEYQIGAIIHAASTARN